MVKQMKILVVDDEDIVLESCQAVLEEEGFEVLLVSSADRAIETMKNEDVTLLLIDLKMPKHDGMYLIEEIKRDWPSIPIIAMSGYYTTQTIRDVVKKGAISFIAKPFEPDELVVMLRKIIKKEVRYGKKEGNSD